MLAELCRLACFLGALATTHADETSTQLPSFYHSSDQLQGELDRLTKKCPGWSRETRTDPTLPEGTSPELDVVRIKLSHDTPKSVGHRVAMVFGEHARELVTVESSLHFLKALCGEIDTSTGLSSLMQKGNDDSGSGSISDAASESESVTTLSNVASLLGDSVSELLIFPNANPVSRRVVERGDFCERLNPNGVDLNRNWDAHWTSQDTSAWNDAPSGEHPFSEPESRILRDTLAEYKPTFYLSVHSGNLGVFAPYAYASNAPLPNSETMSLLQKVSKEYCQCPFGGAANTIGYNCPGASIDYVYDTLHATRSFAVEIWIGENAQRPFHERYEAQIAGTPALASFLQQRHKRHAIAKLQTDESEDRSAEEMFRDPSWCLQNFNPTHHDDYQDVLKRWTQAYLTMIKESPKESATELRPVTKHGADHVM